MHALIDKLAKAAGAGLVLATMISGGALASPQKLSDQEMASVTAGSSSVVLGFDDGQIHISLDGTSLKVTGSTTDTHTLTITADGRQFHLSGTSFNFNETLPAPSDSVVVTTGMQTSTAGTSGNAVVITTDKAASVSSVSQSMGGSGNAATVVSTIGQSSSTTLKDATTKASSILRSLGVSLGH